MTTEERKIIELQDMETLPDENFKAVSISPEIENGLGNVGEISEDREQPDNNIQDDGDQAKKPHLGVDEGSREIAENTDEQVRFNLSELIDPETAVDLLNWLIPMLVEVIGSKFNVPIDKKDMEFDSKEKKTLQKPLTKAFNQTSTGTKNPWLALVIVLVLMVLVKFWSAWVTAKEREREEADGNTDIYKPAKSSPAKSKRGRKPGGKNKSKITPQPDIILQPNENML